ncbi:adenosine deaminase [Uliginosibacterium sp. 31-12]|uniref:adenosine deaminase n=1 Tax=Uliginosibacterium sp. 31-12 TaxID=3062781 RepID=UPI0026E174D5|nr:adenosine deaminase [Uliginosibacterium sp. 31-12]MDO6387698.1 adenosine deaminase [Uliginosibacterium sp. 31-12]
MTHPTPGTVNWPSMPKALLHEHLDGGLRAQTLLDLCAERGIAVPAGSAAELAQWMQSNANSGSLVRYLQGFALTVEAMASAAACRRVAFEAAEDALLDGCVLAEFRMAPLLLEPFGITPEAVVEALLSGLKESRLASGLILCAMRTDTPEASLRTARLAARYSDQGVVGFDLAGAELNYPPGSHQAAYHVAREAGLGLTCHAGEADLGSRVLEAAQIGARRIGHGVNIMAPPDDATGAAWLAEARALNLHFEVCPSSNVHTGTVASLSEHPIRRMLAAGLSVSCSTDNRLMSGVTLSEEFSSLEQHLGLSVTEAVRLTRHAIRASFLEESQRLKAMQALDQWLVRSTA